MAGVRLTVLLYLAMCGSVAFGEDARPDVWSKSFTPPAALDTPRVHLEPLSPKHAELDHKAFMSSRDHLHKTLHWGNWPEDDTTVDANRADLARHEREFKNREAYAYTVLTPDRKRCVGCIYLNPVKNKPRATAMAYWVVEDELSNDLDRHLLEAVLGWIERDWPLDIVIMPLHTDNTRSATIAIDLDLRSRGRPKHDMVRYIWQRGKK